MTTRPRLLPAIILGSAIAWGVTGAAQARDLLTLDLVNEPSSLDPHMQWNPDSYFVYRNIFDNLLTRDNSGAIVPQIASSWKQLSDTEIEFTIRDDVRFHDGKPLTADDVVYSVQRITDPAFGSPQLSQFNSIVKAEVRDGSKVVLTTDKAYPALLAQLVKLSIVPRHVVEAVGRDAFNLAPVGSGPYRFGDWTRGVSVSLKVNDDYWGDKGQFKEAVFRAVPDAATRMANLQAGASDLIVTINSDMAAQLEGRDDVKPLSVLTERVAYFALNPTKAPMDDPALRKAVALAIDKEGITEGILGGYDKPVDQFMSPAHFGWVDGLQGSGHDLEQARALVKAAGAAGQTQFPILTSPVYDQRVVQAIQQMLIEAGFQVTIEMTDMANWLKDMQSGPTGIPVSAFSRWSCACQDADGILFPTLHGDSGWASAGDKDLEAALEAARSTLDPAARLASYARAQEIVKEQTYLVPLYQSAIIYGAAAGLEWTPTPNESLFLNRMSWKD